MEVWFGFMVAGFALAGSPGPNTLSLTAAGAAFGARAGLRYAAGLLAGMVVVMVVTGSGVAGLLLALPGAKPVLLGVAAAYFLYLAVRIATAPHLSEQSGDAPRPKFGAGLLQSLVNPKAYAAMAAMFSGFVLLGGRPGADALVKGLLLAGIIAMVNVAWLLAGAALTRTMRNPRASRIINVTFALLLIVSVVLALLL